MFTTKIFTARDMRPVKVKHSNVMKTLQAKGGIAVFPKKKLVKQFWQAMRQDSQSRKVSERGFTKKNLEQFLAKTLNNKKDGFTDRRVRKMIDAFGVKKGRVISYAAEMRRVEKNEQHQQAQLKVAQQRQQDSQFRERMKKIIGSRRENSNPAPAASSSPQHQLPSNQGFVSSAKPVSFGVSNSNLRKAENMLGHMPSYQAEKIFHQSTEPIHDGTSGYVPNHLKQFSNQHQNIDEVKSMLAKIQGEGDNESEPNEEI